MQGDDRSMADCIVSIVELYSWVTDAIRTHDLVHLCRFYSSLLFNRTSYLRTHTHTHTYTYAYIFNIRTVVISASRMFARERE